MSDRWPWLWANPSSTAYRRLSFSAWYFVYESTVRRKGSSHLDQSWMVMPSNSSVGEHL